MGALPCTINTHKMYGRNKAIGPAAESTRKGKKKFNLDEQSGCHL